MNALALDRVVNILTGVSGYLIILLMVIYTIQSYTVFRRKGAAAKRYVFLRQNISMFVIHFIAFLVLFLEKLNFRIMVFYSVQAIYLLLTLVLFNVIYPRASRLLINNMCMLITIGFIMITRLSYDQSVKQFEIAAAGMVLSLLIPLTGLGKKTAILGMTAYNLILLLRNIDAARKAIPAAVSDAAAGMGLTSQQTLRLVNLPIMLPYLISGLRVATVSTTGITTMAGLINAGGLGGILFEGMRSYHMPKIIWGIALVSGLALCLNAIFARLENKAVLYANGGKKVK